jgi:multiple sugar transport system ATP-binding protein
VHTRLEIARLHHDLKATMIYVTHDQVEAMTLADKIVVMNAGRIEQIGSPMELYNNPANLFVAGFIGSPQMNFIDAGSVGVSGAKTIGLRPEHLAVNPAEGRWKGKLVHAEHLGADTNFYIDTENAGTLTVRAFGEVRYPTDSTVYVSPIDDRHIYRFDESGRTITG